jgi:hypothetical protein
MDAQISTRIQQWLADELDRAELPNRSRVIRETLRDELVEATVGVCAITGKLCYGDSSEVGMDSPLGKQIPIPDDIPHIRLTAEQFDTLSKQHATGELTEADFTDLYANDVGPATYFAENQYLAAAEAGELVHEDSWMASNSRYVKLKPQIEEDDFATELRAIGALEWCHITDDTPDVVTIQAIWDEQDEDIQNHLIGKGYENMDMGDGEALLVDILDELGVDYDRAVI